ncbi:MAG: NAD-dependent epimerase/dehydratase family protein [Planctomycetota bacterium]
MRYLITGGAGFIGSTLAETLLKKNQEVCIIDDLSTGRFENILPLKLYAPHFSYHIESIFSPVLAELIDYADVVFHLAAAVGVRLVVSHPVETLETNIRGTERVLALARKKKKKILIASTSEVYGKSDQIPYREDSDLVFGPTTNSRWSYACSKVIDEFLALAYYRKEQLPIVIFRLFNTVGPKQVGNYGMVIPTFIQQALNGGPIIVYGDGSQTRCFAYIDDVVWALRHLANEEKAVGEIFNIGSTEETSIVQLAQKIRQKIDPNLSIVFKPYEDAYEKGFEDMKRRIPSIDKISHCIGYNPVHSLDQILEKTIAHFKTL